MRVKLCEKYKQEREEICKKLIDILQLDSNNSFLLCDLDADLEKQTAIMNMKEEIQKCFACSTISSFKPNFECKRPYLNIVKSILRKQNYLFNGISNVIKYDINALKLGVRLTNMNICGIYRGKHTNKGDTKIFNIFELKAAFKLGCLIEL